MSVGIIGTKIGMTQIFNKEGLAIPITIVQAGPCIITQVKNTERDGYNAVQLGYYPTKSNYLTKAQIGHLNRAGVINLRYLFEYPVESVTEFQVGKYVTVEKFKTGQFVNISGKTIGKGFTGCRKRHNFSRGPMTHGSKNHRQPGSIGPGTTPGRIFPGKKMAGRAGNTTVTIKNLQVTNVDVSNNILMIKGAIPGVYGNLINIIKTCYL
uniref:Large ribosomal subunit protein uL3c n=1 Tax=Apophlaea sinclairii TaxID=212746 RepID=A0A1C9CBY7_9FLOR|nr:ribosomal protein L3 [Apophlaea sinclairii]AOM65879.1 ribosomal protein L3 [Apophlaea sinclairii]